MAAAQPRAERTMGVRQQRQLGVRRGQHDDVARRLAEIARLGAVVDGAGLGDEQVHQPRPG